MTDARNVNAEKIRLQLLDWVRINLPTLICQHEGRLIFLCVLCCCEYLPRPLNKKIVSTFSYSFSFFLFKNVLKCHKKVFLVLCMTASNKNLTFLHVKSSVKCFKCCRTKNTFKLLQSIWILCLERKKIAKFAKKKKMQWIQSFMALGYYMYVITQTVHLNYTCKNNLNCQDNLAKVLYLNI